MRPLGILVSLLFDVRAHIPNQSRFASGPARDSRRALVVRVIAGVFVTVAFLSAVLWLAVRLAIGFL